MSDQMTLADITVENWVQGGPLDVTSLKGSVVLVDVFQVNCPGCFMFALPQAIELHEQYHEKGLVVIGLATAFEDYDKNTLANLQKFVETGEVIGETFKALHTRGAVKDKKVSWKLPFAVGMDRVSEDNEPVTDERAYKSACNLVENFDTYPDEQKQAVIVQIKKYLEQKTMKAETFERFALQGTPSTILFDREGNLKDVSFGQTIHPKALIEECLG